MTPAERAELIEYVMKQGVPREAACELVQRKLSNPNLTMCQHRGKMISLSPPTAESIARFDAMVAAGVPPAARTDREFLEGTANGRQFEKNPAAGDFYKKEAEKRGGSTKGRRYLSQLARFPGDPEAWVSDRHDVQKVLEGRGWGCDGSVKTPLVEKEPITKPRVDVADDVINEVVATELEGQTVTKKEYVKARAKVKERLKGKKRGR